MAKFDSYGGNFAPLGYMRINEGGSHDENPNGGVQVGTDPQGVPNLLEEDETVYNDYVYSDNIYIDGGMLEKHKLPKNLNGKLYSEAADQFANEIEGMENDPIALRGFNSNMVRLMNAQEEQKQIQQQKELEEELAKMSPEEIAELENQLMQMQAAEQQQAVPQEQMAVDPTMMSQQEAMAQQEIPVEQAAPVQAPAQMPMMAMGGTLLRKYDMGGPEGDGFAGGGVGGGTRDGRWNADQARVFAQNVEIPSLLELALGSDNDVVQFTNRVGDWFDNTAGGNIARLFVPTDAMGNIAIGSPLVRSAKYSAAPLGRALKRGAKKTWNAIKSVPKNSIENRKRMLEEVGAARLESKDAAKTAREVFDKAEQEYQAAKAALKASPNDKSLMQDVVEKEAASAKAAAASLKASAKSTGAAITGAGKGLGALTVGPMYNRVALEKEIEGLTKAYETAKAAADASPKSDALKEAAEQALKELEKAKGNWNKWWSHGKWQAKGIATGAGVGYGVLKHKENKNNEWLEQMFALSPEQKIDESVQRKDYGGRLFYGGGSMTPEEFYRIYGVWPEGYGYDSSWTPEKVASVNETFLEPIDMSGYIEPAIVTAEMPRRPMVGASGNGEMTPEEYYRIYGTSMPGGYSYDQYAYWTPEKYESVYGSYSDPSLVTESPSSTSVSTTTSATTNATGSPDGSAETTPTKTSGNGRLTVIPRYAGIVGNSIFALQNALTKPTRFSMPHTPPVLPVGRLDLQPEVYNPVDMNYLQNQYAAQNAGLQRGLRNSGIGPSTGANMIAGHHTGTQNLGTALLQGWDANNQRLNSTIAADNSNAKQKADFDYTLDATRAQILNNYRRLMDTDWLQLQQMNDAAETQKYQALSNQLGNVFQGLAGVGQENFSMNQLNTNPALYYRVNPDGTMSYDPRWGLLYGTRGINKEGEEKSCGGFIKPYKG